MSKAIGINKRIHETSTVIKSLSSISDDIENAIKLVSKQILKNGIVYWCGNGGSAADAQHMAAELMGKLNSMRQPIKSLALTTDTSFITAWANDLSYEEICSRPLEGFGPKNDILIAISTSGKSQNIINALKKAKELGMPTILLIGRDIPEDVNKLVDITLSVNSSNILKYHN